MSCSCTFSPATVPASSDPSKHVNFSTGVVLGVEDYRQEFAYHSARDRWIVREIAGYGTLSGLSVSLDRDESDVLTDKLRISAGTAAAPSGQLICVGADQCALLNSWLSTADVVEKVNAIDAHRTPADSATIKVWLTLCYTNCAVAPVPIPGQPCRSEEDLMAPSRIADDYRLSLSFDPPEIGETDYLRLLAQYRQALPPAAALPATQALRRALVRRIRRQAKLLFAPVPDAFAVGDDAAVELHPDMAPEIVEELRNLWITELRPQVVPPPCSGAGASTNDCVPLAALTIDVIKGTTGWVIDNSGGPLKVDIDQSDRPFIQSLALAASPFGIAATLPPPPTQEIAWLSANGSINATTDLALIRAAAPTDALTIGITGGGNARPQRKLYIRNAGEANVRLVPNNSGVIDGEAGKDLSPGAFVYLAYDGAGNWRTRAGRW
ncbi:hypothetical protein [Sphingorhabdus sp.]|uniref:hypothetical protein n=2 Tax=Sphingorhabdus sp. TaxID=1902408 RepID=UPI003BB13B78